MSFRKPRFSAEFITLEQTATPINSPDVSFSFSTYEFCVSLDSKAALSKCLKDVDALCARKSDEVDKVKIDFCVKDVWHQLDE